MFDFQRSAVCQTEDQNWADVLVPGAVCEQPASPPCNAAEIVALKRGRNFKIKGNQQGIQTVLDGLKPLCKECVLSTVGETWEGPELRAVERVCALQELTNAELLFNKRLVVCNVEWPPYFSVDRSKVGDSRYTGLDVQVLQQLSRSTYMNAPLHACMHYPSVGCLASLTNSDLCTIQIQP